MSNYLPTHLGVILLEEFLEPMNITQVALANHLNIPVQRILALHRPKEIKQAIMA